MLEENIWEGEKPDLETGAEVNPYGYGDMNNLFRRRIRGDVMFQGVEKYQTRFSWLKDSKFLQDLENDSVDSELLEEELTALQEEEILTSRQKLVKCLQSNPVQILLCVVVLLDAGIVIAQILLDLHSVREKLHRREDDLSRLLVYIKESRPDLFNTYDGMDVDYVLEMLEKGAGWNNLTQGDGPPTYSHHPQGKLPLTPGPSVSPGPPDRGTSTNEVFRSHESEDPILLESPGNKDNGKANRTTWPGADDGSKMQLGSHNGAGGGGIHSSPPVNSGPGESKQSTHDTRNMQVATDNNGHSNNNNHNNVKNISHGAVCENCPEQVVFHDRKQSHFVVEDENDTLHEVAHGLHFASIALLGFLVFEDLVKICAMGKDFFKHKIEIFDAIIIICSFIFDIIFLGGVTGEEGEKAAAVLVVLLLWRIMRVVDGIVITAKQRQEFRIRLQKRARRKAEKRVDLLEEEKHTRLRQVNALKDLCTKAGIHDDDIEQCTPKRPRRVSHTMCALSSVARLSVSMTMSMSSGLFSMAEDDTDKSDDKSDGDKEERLSIELLRMDRRHSLPSGLPSGKMSDIEEESSSNRGSIDIDSPINSSGIKIIIDEGSDSDSQPRSLEEHSTMLELEELSNEHTDRRASHNSEVHLLA